MIQSDDLRFHESNDSGDDGNSGWPDRRNVKIHVESYQDYDSGGSKHGKDPEAVGKWNACTWAYDHGLAVVIALDCIDEFFE
jgi:hypothetical protein